MTDEKTKPDASTDPQGRLEALVRLSLVPITLREARAYVEQKHRHHRAPQGGIFAVAVADGDDIEGVAIVGRPVARNASDGWTAEVTRLCTDGARNAPSKLYRAAWRAARGMGYRRLITYTLPEEGGASLRGAGFRLIGECGGGSWSRKERPRVDTHPMQAKLRWEIADYRCSVAGCNNVAFDQGADQQPSVCTAHDPGR